MGYSHDTSSASGGPSSTSRANETGTMTIRGTASSNQTIPNNPPGPQASEQSNHPSPEPPVQLDTRKPKANGQGVDPRQRAASSTRIGPSRYRQPSCSGRVPTSHPQTGNDAQTPDVLLEHKTASPNVANRGPEPALVVPQIPLVWRDPSLQSLSQPTVQANAGIAPEADDANNTPLPAAYHPNHPQVQQRPSAQDLASQASVYFDALEHHEAESEQSSAPQPQPKSPSQSPYDDLNFNLAILPLVHLDPSFSILRLIAKTADNQGLKNREQSQNRAQAYAEQSAMAFKQAQEAKQELEKARNHMTELQKRRALPTPPCTDPSHSINEDLPMPSTSLSSQESAPQARTRQNIEQTQTETQSLANESLRERAARMASNQQSTQQYRSPPQMRAIPGGLDNLPIHRTPLLSSVPSYTPSPSLLTTNSNANPNPSPLDPSSTITLAPNPDNTNPPSEPSSNPNANPAFQTGYTYVSTPLTSCKSRLGDFMCNGKSFFAGACCAVLRCVDGCWCGGDCERETDCWEGMRG